MKTPIYNFVQKYAKSDVARMHMPGHKGVGEIEKYDITEVFGADSLYEADGIIAQSEANASELFGARTIYSAEGSSLSIRAMLYLAMLYGKKRGLAPKILAARNAHKSFASALGLLDIDVEWLLPKNSDSYLSSPVDKAVLEEALRRSDETPVAVYITSPDYLGGEVKIGEIAEVCHKYGVLLLVDNAHGAYLKFLNPSRHPIDLGADMCCDSAHKTLPSLTGAGYLHISKNAPDVLFENAKRAMSLFGSTSPSYLILSSLDKTNLYLASGYRERLSEFILRVDEIKAGLVNAGYTLFGSEPLKITILAKKFGYTGVELAKLLSGYGIVTEFSDPDYLVLMLTPENTDEELSRLLLALTAVPKLTEITSVPPKLTLPRRAMSIREAILSGGVTVSAREAVGRVISAVTVGCPPAVPILVSGVVIDACCRDAFLYYGITEISVVE